MLKSYLRRRVRWQSSHSTPPSHEPFLQRLRARLNDTPTKWYPLPLGAGIAILCFLSFLKARTRYSDAERLAREKQAGTGEGEERVPPVRVKGPWQVHVIGALPLRTISRIYGALNSYTLPVWCRVPGFKLYALVFGVNLEECETDDLTTYRSLSEFFMRRLKEGARPIADTILVSPADGRIVNFGTIKGSRVESIKGASYSLDALLSGSGASTPIPSTPGSSTPSETPPLNPDHHIVSEREFANLNGLEYSLTDLVAGTKEQQADRRVEKAEDGKEGGETDETVDRKSASQEAAVAMELEGEGWAPWKGTRTGTKLFYTVVYLAPGDYHRFHSPTNWVCERRRHFGGELFSVSPWMVGKLADLFVLNERVALLGRWRHGFFSMVPVGATNVGSIRINFDKSLRTNSPLRPTIPGTFTEANYKSASLTLNGQPIRIGEEMGGFWLGSTIVLVFEAPETFSFLVKEGEKVKVGQALGEVKT
ncbi:phosphatidylserine decarboxylase [Atractiella rhizophila]|nr:phosphatidylserine decarboxylase [Atractiella rhizophila]